MTRVSEHSNTLALNHSIHKAKNKLENLQLQGSSLKRINKPSDDPVGNIEVLSLKSRKSDNEQFLKNINYAKMNLNLIENSLIDLTEIMMRAKELAIGMSSDFYSPEIRKSISHEVSQLKQQALGIANKRLGNRYVFSGQTTLTKPFDMEGKYYGDNGRITIEVSKDFYVPISLSGNDIFFSTPSTKDLEFNPLKKFKNINTDETQKNRKANSKYEEFKPGQIDEDGKPVQKREIASLDRIPEISPDDENFSIEEEQKIFKKRNSLLGQLDSLLVSLNSNNPDIIQSLLEELDSSLERLVTLRTRIGAISNSINISQNSIEADNIVLEESRSKMEDADAAELFMDLNKQQQVLQSTYKASQNLLNNSLLDFLR